MPQYLLSIYQPDGPAPDPVDLDAIMRDLGELREEMKDQGAWVFGAGLHAPETATVIRARDGQVATTDGPFTEGKEHLGGFTIVEAADLDAALGWGTRLAKASTLPVEVRPFQEER
jgi:hypothetical protein